MVPRGDLDRLDEHADALARLRRDHLAHRVVQRPARVALPDRLAQPQHFGGIVYQRGAALDLHTAQLAVCLARLDETGALWGRGAG